MTDETPAARLTDINEHLISSSLCGPGHEANAEVHVAKRSIMPDQLLSTLHMRVLVKTGIVQVDTRGPTEAAPTI